MGDPHLHVQVDVRVFVVLWSLLLLRVQDVHADDGELILHFLDLDLERLDELFKLTDSCLGLLRKILEPLGMDQPGLQVTVLRLSVRDLGVDVDILLPVTNNLKLFYYS